MHYLRYVWSGLLLMAAILSPNVANTVTLLVAGVVTIVLALSREQFLVKVMRDVADTLPFTKPLVSTALERSMLRTQKQLLTLAVIAELIIFLATLFFRLDITVARNYALLVLVALAPLGLELTLAVLVRSKHNHSSETVRTAIGYAVEDARLLLIIIGLSLLSTLTLHIPPALSVMQILLLTCVVRPLLSGQMLQAMPHKVDRAWRIFFASLIVYGSFIFFFIRHYLEPRYADPINVITWQATTVAMLSFIACQVALLAFNPKAPKASLYRGFILALILLFVTYLSPLQSYFMTHGPDPADWAWIIIAGLTFTALVLLRQQLNQHSRKTVLALHRR